MASPAKVFEFKNVERTDLTFTPNPENAEIAEDYTERVEVVSSARAIKS